MAKYTRQQPHLLKIIPPFEHSIVVKGDNISWNNPWHFHPEIELIHCIKGKGTTFIGNSIRAVEEGEVLLIGCNVPHTRQRDRDYYLSHPDEEPESIIVQFREDFLGDRFFDVREFIPIKDMLARALRGVKFLGETRRLVAACLQRMRVLEGAPRIVELLLLLDLMAHSQEFNYLNTTNYISDAHEKSSQKINKVYHYTIDHFRDPIALSTVASLTGHSTASFCRYFKTRTRTSYIQYLTEMRIAFACQQLMDGSVDVGQVCFSSGFNNLSHFHKQFRRLMGMTPGEYMKRSTKKVVGE
ncbi:MAG TPA: AraC family transcriptional regulator [Chryseolinea sp.]|nr:AraC family transcriptional regulator [Chryseolinea sp.]